MSRTGVDETVERLRVDRDLAQAVVAEGAPALAATDLTEEERTAIVDALRLDVEEALGEVTGFAQGGIDLGAIHLTNLAEVGRSFGGGTMPSAMGGHAGWVETGWIEKGQGTQF